MASGDATEHEFVLWENQINTDFLCEVCGEGSASPLHVDEDPTAGFMIPQDR